MARLKALGDTAEMAVALDLMRRGYKVAFPYGEDWDYDIILCRGNALERVQVKYTRSDGEVVFVRCRSHSLTNAGSARPSGIPQRRSTGSRSTTGVPNAASTFRLASSPTAARSSPSA
jgi:hypothetical protein